ncbi:MULTISPECIES: hypothetical protein [unclassified Rathayibacter]|uniref:hypothetical protein n=1 Tax=unclassified Rathayibacter TaxID=2609250 RepID=UPI000CE8A002|nr:MULTISPECIES: hypothetical protein [unclassified Rathayibacter]PPG76793.1 hypothetical protein C5C52_14955 [Rathayibacter sp. AY1E5]PPH26604.1 hypothetical protein C5C94_16720 [Rathayibacter sp. AY1C3]PPH59341.1 hypothetical protein C5D25_12875 [Rathayibacter sp. AY1D7]PPI26481.1 hypothetical protein C5D66_16635 [Rathayibacter sp. AY1B4]
MTIRRARTLTRSIFGLCVALVLSGCATSATSPGSSLTSQVPGELLSAEDATKPVYETTSVIGDQGSGGWLLDHPVSLRIIGIDGQSKLNVDGPCNTLTYDLQSAGLQPSVWVVTEGPATTYVGCLDVAGEREQWLVGTLGAEDVSLTQTTTAMRIRSGPVTIDATASTTPIPTETPAEPTEMTEALTPTVPTEGPPGTPIATAASEGPMIDVQQLTNPALDLANGLGTRLSTLGAEEKKQYPIYAVRTTYKELAAYEPALADHYWVAPDEPVWALTVHAPAEKTDVPYGFDLHRVDVFTAVYDGISGELLATRGDVDLASLGAPGELITAA